MHSGTTPHQDWPAKLKRVFLMLKIILSLITSIGPLEADVEGLINEIKDSPSGMSMLTNGLAALKQLVTDIEKAIS